MNHRIILLLGLFISIMYFLMHLILMKDYALSWDYHYHHYAGLYHLGLPVPSINDKPEVPFSPPDPRLTTEDPFGPFTQILPSLSQVIFHERLNILPFDTAYNLPMVIFGSLGLGLLFIFMAETVGVTAGISGTFFLGLYPSYFAYLHNNMKDIPNAFVFTLSVFAFYRLVRKKNFKSLLIAATSFAFAFNIKINSVMVPFVCLIWVCLYLHREIIKALKGGFKKFVKGKYLHILSYFLLSPVLALLLWMPFWKNPIEKLMELPFFYSHNTINMPVLLSGRIYYSGVNIPFYYPYLYLLINTQLTILFAFVMGMFIVIKKYRDKSGIYLLLLAWFFVPLFRYLSPKAGAIDGVRHFMEVLYPFCFIAGIGAAGLYKNILMSIKNKAVLYSIAIFIIFMTIFPIIRYYPYQASYYNIFAGGIKGASENFDIDFWGTPQKEAIIWLNNNVPLNSSVYVVMAQSTAGVYARDDLKNNLNLKSLSESDYIVVLNRKSFFWIYGIDSLIKEKQIQNKIAYKKEIGGVPLVWVLKK